MLQHKYFQLLCKPSTKDDNIKNNDNYNMMMMMMLLLNLQQCDNWGWQKKSVLLIYMRLEEQKRTMGALQTILVCAIKCVQRAMFVEVANDTTNGRNDYRAQIWLLKMSTTYLSIDKNERDLWLTALKYIGLIFFNVISIMNKIKKCTICFKYWLRH